MCSVELPDPFQISFKQPRVSVSLGVSSVVSEQRVSIMCSARWSLGYRVTSGVFIFSHSGSFGVMTPIAAETLSLLSAGDI